MVLPALVVLAAMPLQGAATLEEIARRLRVEIREGRARAGIPAAPEPAAVLLVARQRAQEAARMPERRRLAGEHDTRAELRRAGLGRVLEVQEYMQEQEGHADPAAAAVRGFRSHPLWRHALDPSVTAIGAAAAEAADGSVLVVVLLVEEAPVRDLRELESATEKAVNRVRVQHGLRPLVPSEVLIETARAHSEDMLRRNFFDHEDPRGRKPADRVTSAGVSWTRVTENLAMNSGMDDPVASAVQGWMESPGHRANILDPAVTHTGVGIAEDEDGGYTFTQLFVAMRSTAR